MVGVGIHPTQTLFVPNIPTTLPAQQWEVERAPTVSMERNIRAFSLLPPLLASLLESEKVAQIQSLGWSQGPQPGPDLQFNILPACLATCPHHSSKQGLLKGWVQCFLGMYGSLCLDSQGSHSPT